MGAITVSSGVTLSHSTKSTYDLTVTATDVAMNEATTTVTIRVSAPPDTTAPVFGETLYAFNVAPSAAASTVIGTISATDNRSTTLTYSLTGPGHDKFAIDATRAS